MNQTEASNAAANDPFALNDVQAELYARDLQLLAHLQQAAEVHDPDIASHMLRMSQYARLIASSLGLDYEQQETVLAATGVHDIGKLGIPDEILHKRMQLSASEQMIARQHVLLEGLPGVGKTETAKAFADVVEGAFQRVQGTPDKLPSDILGTEVLQEDPATGKKAFELSKGPIFTNVLLVDEINRMPPKAQAALLEAMAEGRVTIGRSTLDLMRFTVMATQNPVEQDGTYRLPEAQLDRFMFKVLVPQPSAADLKVIMARNRSKDARPKASKVTSLAELDKIRRTAESIPMDADIEEYIVRIVMAAKEHADLKGSVEYSVYTRAAIFMAQAARIHALMQGRDWVSPADVRAVAPLVMRHRIVLNYQASGTTPDQIVAKILDLVSPPKPKTAVKK